MTKLNHSSSEKIYYQLKPRQTISVSDEPNVQENNMSRTYLWAGYFNIGLACLVISFFILLSLFVSIEVDPVVAPDKDCLRCHRYDDLYKNIGLNSIPKRSTCQRNEFSSEVSSLNSSNYRIVCYYVILNKTAHTRQLPSSYVDPYLCTHIIVGFTTVLNGTLAPSSSEMLDIFKTITNFKHMNPSLKVLLSVEDFSSSGEFGKMVADENLRRKFSAEAINFLNAMNFDGIDLDWEFPAWPVPNNEQSKNFTLLLQNLRNETAVNYNRTYILSVAVAAPEVIIDQSYQIEEMARYIDFINLMSYDYHMYTDYLPLTGPNSPLFPRPSDRLFQQTLNINWSTALWTNCGMPASKINIGIPTYGHSYWLVNEDNNDWNAPAKGFGEIGSGGFITYPDACRFISDPSSTNHFDNNYLVPYSFNGKNWISFDDEISVHHKANFIKDNKLGGAMIYSLNSDDFYGECGSVKFPLLRKISNILS